MSTNDLHDKIQEALSADPVLAMTPIRSSVDAGTVTLEGEVTSEHLRAVAEAAVSPIEGVTAVVNRIRVTTIAEPREVEEKIREALTRSAEIDAERIHVTVDGGKVILRGVVRTWAEVAAAESAAWAAHGVKEVESHLRSDDELARA
jgi:osmotically-inducible protein OsmY